MSKYRKLAHAVYRCEYHIVFVPKYRFRVLSGAIAEMVERDIRALSEWKDVMVRELSVQPDHVHLVCSIPPKIAVSAFIGFLKGKLAIKLFRSYPGLKRKPYWGNHFWARGYFVTTTGVDEEVVRRYVRHQEDREKEDEKHQKGYDLFPER
jgi:putative transposase